MAPDRAEVSPPPTDRLPPATLLNKVPFRPQYPSKNDFTAYMQNGGTNVA